jgi:hypothetical protein
MFGLVLDARIAHRGRYKPLLLVAWANGLVEELPPLAVRSVPLNCPDDGAISNFAEWVRPSPGFGNLDEPPPGVASAP